MLVLARGVGLDQLGDMLQWQRGAVQHEHRRHPRFTLLQFRGQLLDGPLVHHGQNYFGQSLPALAICSRMGGHAVLAHLLAGSPQTLAGAVEQLIHGRRLRAVAQQRLQDHQPGHGARGVHTAAAGLHGVELAGRKPTVVKCQHIRGS